MCENWNYKQLEEMIQKRAIAEMKHSEKQISRIRFLEGKPIVSKLNQIIIGAQVPNMHEYDHGAEETAIRGYNESIHLAAEVGDKITPKCFSSRS